MPKTTPDKYIKNLSNALKFPGARAFYFPPNHERRTKQNKRLGRETGYGLADWPDALIVPVLSSLYSLLIVQHSLDTTGVCIDAKDFLKEIRAGIKRATSV